MPLKGQKVCFHLLLRRKARYKTEICLFPIQILILKIGARLFMAEFWSVGLWTNFSQSIETHRSGQNRSGVQQTVGMLQTTSKTVSERVNFREIDPKYLIFSQFLVS